MKTFWKIHFGVLALLAIVVMLVSVYDFEHESQSFIPMTGLLTAFAVAGFIAYAVLTSAVIWIVERFAPGRGIAIHLLIMVVPLGVVTWVTIEDVRREAGLAARLPAEKATLAACFRLERWTTDRDPDEPRVRIEGRAGAPGRIRLGGFEMLEGEHGPETHHVVEPNGGITRDVAPGDPVVFEIRLARVGPGTPGRTRFTLYCPTGIVDYKTWVQAETAYRNHAGGMILDRPLPAPAF